MDVNARVEQLERENRRMKKIGIVAAVVVSTVIIGGQAKTDKVVEANEFRLVDSSAKERASLLVSFGQAALVFYSADGTSDVLVGNDVSCRVAYGSSDTRENLIRPRVFFTAIQCRFIIRRCTGRSSRMPTGFKLLVRSQTGEILL